MATPKSDSCSKVKKIEAAVIVPARVEKAEGTMLARHTSVPAAGLDRNMAVATVVVFRTT